MFKPLVFEVLSCLLYKPDGGMGGSNGVQDGCQLYELMFDGVSLHDSTEQSLGSLK